MALKSVTIRFEFISETAQLRREGLFPDFPYSKREYTKLFIYHRYLNQLDRDALLYCLDMVNIGKYPVICLINDYSLENDKPSEALLSFINEYFEQYDIV